MLRLFFDQQLKRVNLMKRLYLCIFLLVLIALPLSSQNERSIDVIRTLDNTGNVGQLNEIAISPSGNPVIGYNESIDNGIKFIACGDPTCDPATNTVRTLVSESVGFNGMALNPSGNPVIGISDFESDNLEVLFCSDPTCDPTGVTTRTVYLQRSGLGDIAVASNGNPVFAFVEFDSSNNRTPRVLFCGNATCNGGNSTVTLGGVGSINSFMTVALLPNDVPVFVYRDAQDMIFVACSDPGCTGTINTRTLLSGDSGGYSYNLIIGNDGNPIITHTLTDDDTAEAIFCGDITCDPATNVQRTLLTDAIPTNITIGSDGNPIIGYLEAPDFEANGLIFCGDATCTPANITARQLDSVVGNMDLAVLSSDNPVVSYYDGENTNLKFAYVDSIRPQIITRVYPQPGETLTGAMKSVLWGAVDGIDWYNVRVVRGGQEIVNGWVSEKDACNAAGVCAVYGDSDFLDFPDAILNGTYSLSFRTYDIETDTLSMFDDPTAFTLSVPAPAAPVITLPQNPLTQPVRVFEWENDPAALWYNVRLTTSSATLSDDWYYAPSICTASSCTVEQPLLNPGSYTLEVSIWGPGVTGTSFPGTIRAFIVPNDPPGAVTLTSPSPASPVTAGANRALIWNDDVNTLWYRVVVLSPRAGVVGEQWVEGAAICENGECSLSVDLVPGNYEVRIAGWGPANVVSEFTSSTFTVTE
jgi:hypothetical protein